MKRKAEMQRTRLLEIIKTHLSIVISDDRLLKDVNFLLPDNLVIPSLHSLAGLIRTQHEFKVFRCRYYQKIYFIFKKYLPVEE